MLAEQVEERSADLETRSRALDFCIEQLPLVERKMVAGCYAEGSNIRSFAEKAGETANTIYKRLNRVRGQLQQCIERRLGLEEEALG